MSQWLNSVQSFCGTSFINSCSNFHRVRSFRQAKPVREPRDVRVHDHADVDAERISQNDVRRLAPDAGERVQFVHRARHFAAEFFHERGAAGFDVLRLVFVKAGRANVILPVRQFRRVRKIFCAAIFFEQFRRDEVHALVRALRGKNRGDEQFQRIGKIQFAMRVGISPLERGEMIFCVRSYFGGGGFAWHRNDFVRSAEK